MVEDLLGHRAEQGPLHTPEAAGAHHDEVGVEIPRGHDDLLGSIPGRRVAIHARELVAELPSRALQRPVELAAPLVLELLQDLTELSSGGRRRRRGVAQALHYAEQAQAS